MLKLCLPYKISGDDSLVENTITVFIHIFVFSVGFVCTCCAEVEEVDVKVLFLPDYFSPVTTFWKHL